MIKILVSVFILNLFTYDFVDYLSDMLYIKMLK